MADEYVYKKASECLNLKGITPLDCEFLVFRKVFSPRDITVLVALALHGYIPLKKRK